MANLTEFNLVCPHCNKQNLIAVDLDLFSTNVKCLNCNSSFSTRIVKSRSRNSRKVTSPKRKDGINLDERHFSIRVKDFRGAEDLIEFVNGGRENFEFRSGDTVGFTYKTPLTPNNKKTNKLHLVQNFTINEWMNIAPAPHWLPLVSSIILVLVIILFCKLCGV